jgi:hypothetical protein
VSPEGEPDIQFGTLWSYSTSVGQFWLYFKPRFRPADFISGYAIRAVGVASPLHRSSPKFGKRVELRIRRGAEGPGALDRELCQDSRANCRSNGWGH